jgi:hypothetical protein
MIEGLIKVQEVTYRGNNRGRKYWLADRDIDRIGPNKP